MNYGIIIVLYNFLPILSKVCERTALIMNQFLPDLELHEGISAKQSGNRKLHSTEISLIIQVIYNDVLLSPPECIHQNPRHISVQL
jgi:hypothetical protein